MRRARSSTIRRACGAGRRNPAKLFVAVDGDDLVGMILSLVPRPTWRARLTHALRQETIARKSSWRRRSRSQTSGRSGGGGNRTRASFRSENLAARRPLPALDAPAAGRLKIAVRTRRRVVRFE